MGWAFSRAGERWAARGHAGLVLVRCTGEQASREGSPMASPLLEVVGLRKQYGVTLALDDVTFQVEEREMFGVLGPTGAGKINLLSIIACVLDPSADEVVLHARRIHANDRSM